MDGAVLLRTDCERVRSGGDAGSSVGVGELSLTFLCRHVGVSVCRCVGVSVSRSMKKKEREKRRTIFYTRGGWLSTFFLGQKGKKRLREKAAVEIHWGTIIT